MKLDVKTSRKILILGTVVTIIGVAIWALFNFPAARQQLQAPPASVQEIVDANETIDSNSEFNSPSAVLPESEAATLTVSESMYAESTGPGPEIFTKLEEISMGLNRQNDAFLYFDEHLQPITAMLPKIESALALQSSTTKRLEQKISGLETQIALLSDAIDKPEPSNQSDDQVPPFRLIAIDRWNNEWNAVIELDGNISMIGPHSTRAGWLLLEVDPGSRSALFQKKSGKKARLKVSG